MRMKQIDNTMVIYPEERLPVTHVRLTYGPIKDKARKILALHDKAITHGVCLEEAQKAPVLGNLFRFSGDTLFSFWRNCSFGTLNGLVVRQMLDMQDQGISHRAAHHALMRTLEYERFIRKADRYERERLPL